MDISKQVLKRSARMGVLYLVIAMVMGTVLTATLSATSSGYQNVTSNGQTLNVRMYLEYLLVPFTAMVALIASIPVCMLFVFDKNAGVLEYLLATGMSQREVFRGYLNASLAIACIAMTPPVLINAAINGASVTTGEVIGLGVLTGIAAVSLVTVLMTAFSSMQRKPTGMNSPLGISLGIFAILPELFLGAILSSYALLFDVIIGAAVMVVALAMLISIDRLIQREKLLP